MASPRGLAPVAAVFLHLAVIIGFGYTFWWQKKYLRLPVTDPRMKFAGIWKYLTQWNFVLQIVFFTLCLLRDLKTMGTKGLYDRSSLTALTDQLYHALVFPMGINVFASFWGIFLVDRELIVPKRMEGHFPDWLNHTLHSVILLTLLLEGMLVYHRLPPRRKSISLLYTVYFTYVAWTLYIALVQGFWVYPFQAVWTWPQRIAGVLAWAVGFFLFYMLGEVLHKIFWPHRRLSAHQQ